MLAWRSHTVKRVSRALCPSLFTKSPTMFDSRLSFVPRIPLRLRRTAWLRGVGRAMVLGGAVAALAACGGDPLVVVGSVDVNVSADVTLIVDFPVATTLVRSPRAINANVAGECTVTRDGFDVSISRDEDGTGLRSVHVSSEAVGVDIGGVSYTALEGDGCFIDVRASGPGYGTITFDIDCTLSDGAGGTVTAVGALGLDGCR